MIVITEYNIYENDYCIIKIFKEIDSAFKYTYENRMITKYDLKETKFYIKKHFNYDLTHKSSAHQYNYIMMNNIQIFNIEKIKNEQNLTEINKHFYNFFKQYMFKKKIKKLKNLNF